MNSINGWASRVVSVNLKCGTFGLYLTRVVLSFVTRKQYEGPTRIRTMTKVRDVMYWRRSSTQNYEFVTRIAPLHVRHQELGLILSGRDKESVLWNFEIYCSLWELGHQLQRCDLKLPLDIMNKACDTWTKHISYLFWGYGIRLLILKSISDEGDEPRNIVQFTDVTRMTSRSADQRLDSVRL